MMTPELWAQVRFFKQIEFEADGFPGTGSNMQPRIIFILDALRGLLARSMRINSGFRTPAHNAAVGGAPNSAHLRGLAVDVKTIGWTENERRDFIVYARKLGVVGVGIARTFIHIDVAERAALATWIYREGKTVGVPVKDELKYI